MDQQQQQRSNLLCARAEAWESHDRETFFQLLQDLGDAFDDDPKVVRCACTELLSRRDNELPLICRVQFLLWHSNSDDNDSARMRHLRDAKDAVQDLQEYNESDDVWEHFVSDSRVYRLRVRIDKRIAEEVAKGEQANMVQAVEDENGEGSIYTETNEPNEVHPPQSVTSSELPIVGTSVSLKHPKRRLDRAKAAAKSVRKFSNDTLVSAQHLASLWKN